MNETRKTTGKTTTMNKPNATNTDNERTTTTMNKPNATNTDNVEQTTTTTNMPNATNNMNRAPRRPGPPTTRNQLHDKDREALKRQTIYLFDQGYNHLEVYHAISKEVRREAIVGLIKTNGTWQVTIAGQADLELITASGIEIRGADVDVRLVGRNILTVSMFGVPVYVSNSMLSDKLHDFGVIQRTPWTRKVFDDLPGVESGTVHCRVELPENVSSLPYACKINDTNILIKHNGQTKVCNICLSDDHLMRSCPQKRHPGWNSKCFACGLIGHFARDCPDQDIEENMTDNDNNDDNNDDNEETSETNENDSDVDYENFKNDDNDEPLIIDEGHASDDMFVERTIPETPTQKRPHTTTTEDDDTDYKYPEGDWASSSPPRRSVRHKAKKRVATMTLNPRDGIIETTNSFAVLEDK